MYTQNKAQYSMNSSNRPYPTYSQNYYQVSPTYPQQVPQYPPQQSQAGGFGLGQLDKIKSFNDSRQHNKIIPEQVRTLQNYVSLMMGLDPATDLKLETRSISLYNSYDSIWRPNHDPVNAAPYAPASFDSASYDLDVLPKDILNDPSTNDEMLLHIFFAFHHSSIQLTCADLLKIRGWTWAINSNAWYRQTASGAYELYSSYEPMLKQTTTKPT